MVRMDRRSYCDGGVMEDILRKHFEELISKEFEKIWDEAIEKAKALPTPPQTEG